MKLIISSSKLDLFCTKPEATLPSLLSLSDLSYQVGGVGQPGRVAPPVVRLQLHHGAVLLVRVVVTVLLVVTPLVLKTGNKEIDVSSH